MRDKLIAAGVKNLHAFGYTKCTAENIMTDEVYKAFFTSMLEDNIGKAGSEVDAVIVKLRAECGDA